MKICEKMVGVLICRVCACVEKPHPKRFDIYPGSPFVWVVCAIIYINKKSI